MALKIPVTLLTVRKWDIDGYPTYFFGADKQLYRVDSRGRVKQNKRVIIGYTAGYILKSKFYSQKQILPMLRRHTPTDRPAGF
jgi:hypothetical protein